MKNIISVLVVPALLLLCSGGIYAQEATEPQPSGSVYRSIPVFTALSLHIGMTYPTGEIAGDGGQESLVGLAYGFSAEGGYRLTENHALILSIGYTVDNLKTEAGFMGSTQTSTITTKHVDIGGGYRYFFRPFYCEAGVLFGIPLGTWVKTSELNGSETETDIPDARCKTKLGLFAGFGYVRPVSNVLYIQASVRFLCTVLPVYDDGDTRLRDNNLVLTIGAGHDF